MKKVIAVIATALIAVGSASAATHLRFSNARELAAYTQRTSHPAERCSAKSSVITCHGTGALGQKVTLHLYKISHTKMLVAYRECFSASSCVTGHRKMHFSGHGF